MTHRLDPLLKPASLAIVGASDRAGSVGRQTLENLLHGGFAGPVYAVNPTHETILGRPCYASLQDLPECVEHVVFAVSDNRIEGLLDEAIAHGARAITVMSQLVLAKDTDPPLLERVRAKVAAAGLLVCGGNSMGFYHFPKSLWVSGFDTRNNHAASGNVTLISHSGSGMSGVIDCEERIDFNLAISTGQELSVCMDEYMDFALDQPETRVIGLFMETVRHPDRMRAVLARAARKNIPVVALKVGRTALSAELAVSHSGALAGRDAAYQALFDHYGVQRVDDMDEWVSSMILLAQPHPVAQGGLVTLHDSGGERQLLIDLAERMNIPLARISENTRATLKSLLDPGLPAVNPLDAWGAGGKDSDEVMAQCLAALMRDDDCAMGAVVHDRAPYGLIYPEYIPYLETGHAASGKPAALVSNRQGTGGDAAVIEVTRAGFPVLDGLRSFLVAVRCLFGYRDFQQRCEANGWPDADQMYETAGPNEAVVAAWRTRLAECNQTRSGAPGETEVLTMLQDFGMPTNPSCNTSSLQQTLKVAQDMGYPVVLKTTRADIHHKAQMGGVALALNDPQTLQSAWQEIHSRLGADMLVAPMIANAEIELVLGMVNDEQFGPLVMIGWGGHAVEQQADVVWALPPFNANHARRLLSGLNNQSVLQAVADTGVKAFCTAAAAFSELVLALQDQIQELDVNPIIISSGRVLAVDALLRLRPAALTATTGANDAEAHTSATERTPAQKQQRKTG